jgi:hypothetical protein
MMNFKYRKITEVLLMSWLCLFATLSCQAEIYMQTTPSGTVQFSDQPTGTTSPVILRKINSYNPGTNLIITTPQIDKPSELKTYEKIIIRTPREAQTFQNQQQIPVSIEMTPALNSKDKIEIWLDDNLYQRGSETQTTLQNIERGEHHLQIKVINAAGKLLNASSLVTFYAHQTIGENKP